MRSCPTTARPNARRPTYRAARHLLAGDTAGRSTRRATRVRTEWVLLTSGTTGVPKLVVHTLASLTAAIKRGQVPEQPIVWSTFYDIRRYGGLQILLRALLGGGSLVLSSAGEPIGGFPGAARRARRHPYLGHAVALAPRADEPGGARDRAALCAPVGRDRRPGDPRQPARVLSAGRRRPRLSPRPRPVSASRSTTGCEGFPASLIGRAGGEVEMKIEDGSLRIRSARTARALSRRGRRRARATPTASSTPATWSSCAATAITSSAGAAASSMSAA